MGVDMRCLPGAFKRGVMFSSDDDFVYHLLQFHLLFCNWSQLKSSDQLPPQVLHVSQGQSINVYCPSMAFLQLTTRRRRLLVTLDQLHTILQSTGFTIGCLPNQVCIYNDQSFSRLCTPLSFLASLLPLTVTVCSAFPIRLPSFPQGGSSSVRRHASQAISLS